MLTKSALVLQAEAPTSAIGVTEILLLTIGIPKSLEISSPVRTRSFAAVNFVVDLSAKAA